MEELVVLDESSGERVDLFIVSRSPDYISRARVQSLVRQGHVTINGEVPRGTSTKVVAGDIVRFVMPEAEDAVPEPEDIPLNILHEDDDLIVLIKSAGMVVHPAPGNWSGTLVNALLHHCGDGLSGIGGVRRPGIVHRLDKQTSGVMVVAKSYRAHIGLQEQFESKKDLERVYIGLVWGSPPQMKGSIVASLGRHPTDRLRRAVVSSDRPDAKRAETDYLVIEKFGDTPKKGPVASLIECRLRTGRTHQIRVHMTHIGCPLLGDSTYGKHYASRSNLLPPVARDALDSLGRQALHAHSLTFTHPTESRRCHFESPLPSDITCMIESLRSSTD